MDILILLYLSYIYICYSHWLIIDFNCVCFRICLDTCLLKRLFALFDRVSVAFRVFFVAWLIFDLRVGIICTKGWNHVWSSYWNLYLSQLVFETYLFAVKMKKCLVRRDWERRGFMLKLEMLDLILSELVHWYFKNSWKF